MSAGPARPAPPPAGSPGGSASTRDGSVPPEQHAGGIFAEVSQVVAAARETFSRFLELVVLEAQRAGVTLVWMIVGGLVAVIFVAAGWLGLMAALGIWAVSLGFPPIAAAVVIALINLAAAAGLIYRCVGLSRDLLFSATRRQLSGKAPVTPPMP